ncbi:MAG: hypothetical protein CL912_28785 [Deltaproteobacteria bacterium]|nr:hypothetical protein [Deltaproteobacteria bacterium]
MTSLSQAAKELWLLLASCYLNNRGKEHNGWLDLRNQCARVAFGLQGGATTARSMSRKAYVSHGFGWLRYQRWIWVTQNAELLATLSGTFVERRYHPK